MNILMIGNVVTFVGAIVMVATGFIKTKNKILIAQCFQYGIMGVGNLILGGITGFVANIISIARNLLSLKVNFTWPFKISFILLQVIMTAFFNEGGFICWLPTIAACIFTWCLDTKSEVLIKFLIIIAQCMWAIYDFSIKNYVGLTFDCLTILSNFIGIILLKYRNNKK